MSGLSHAVVARAARRAGLSGLVEYHSTLTSTSDRAHELVAEGAVHGSLVVADRQTAGRGRRGRRWESPAGLGVYCSVVVRLAEPLDSPSLVVAAVGLGLAEGLERAAPGLAVGLKWPNDLWVGRRKLGGILVESRTAGALVVGFGLNLLQRAEDFPVELRDSSTSVLRETGAHVERDVLLAAALGGLWPRLEAACERREVASLEREYRRRSVLVGESVTLLDGEVPVSGVVVELSVTEGLLLRTDSGVHRHVRAEFAREVRPAAR